MHSFSDIFQVIILGIVEGLTEFLPVSSTGHMILVSSWLDLTGDKINTFEIFIQLGAILAVLVLYWQRFLDLLKFKTKQGETNSFSGFTGMVKIALACAPAFVLGALFHDTIKQKLFTPQSVAAALIVGGLLLVSVERLRRRPTVESIEGISYRQSLFIGCMQCLALWPGMSRSASTIIAGMLVGTKRHVAAEFSFIIAVPVMVAAVGYDMLKSYGAISAADLPMFGLGFVVAFVAALLSIRFFMALLGRFNLAVFGYYRIALGLLTFWLLR